MEKNQYQAAIAGFGFSGLMVLANLVRQSELPLSIVIIGPDISGWGVAYSTPSHLHRLNVRANRMGAFHNDVEGFYKWLQNNNMAYKADDFVPRVVYGEYLSGILSETLKLAQSKNIEVIFIEAEVVSIKQNSRGLELKTSKKHNLSCKNLVLATGNTPPKLLKNPHSNLIVQNFWASISSIPELAKTAESIMLVGTGLTAVDALLYLREIGYDGKVVAISRNGLLPTAHKIPKPYSDKWVLDLFSKSGTRLSGIIKALHSEITAAKKSGFSWHDVVDSIRPHTVAIWQGFSSRQQQKFFKKLFTVWNIHRHRMAEEIHEQVQCEIAQGSFEIVKSDFEKFNPESSLIINCCGPDYTLSNPLLSSLVDNGFALHHPNGVGFVEDKNCKLKSPASIFAIGNLLAGSRLESTAVPELREQAELIARQLCSGM